MPKAFTLLAGVALALALPAAAQRSVSSANPPRTAELRRVAPGSYRLDPNQS